MAKGNLGVVSYQVSPGLFLAVAPLKSAARAPQGAAPAHHVVVVDVSGSMWSDLPAIKRQLREKLPKLVGEQDIVTVIWFSGRGQCGTLLEAEPLARLRDYARLNRQIEDLRTIGMTGFVDPLVRVAQSIGAVRRTDPDRVTNMIFLTDGCDNTSTRAEIMKAAEGAADGIAAAAMIAYGHYADVPMLTSMAERFGGSVVQADGFDAYEPVFDAAIQRKMGAGKRAVVSVPGDPIGGFTFALRDGDLLSFGVEKGEARVPADLDAVYWLSPTIVGTQIVPDIPYLASPGAKLQESSARALDAAYAAVSLFALRMKPDVVRPLLRALGDVALIEQYATCFGKQRYAAFTDAAKHAALGARLTAGWDPKRVPRDDAFTVMDLLRELQAQDGNRVVLDHPEFRYNRIGRRQEDAGERLTHTEAEELEKLTAAWQASSGLDDLKALADRSAAILATKAPALTFTPDPAPYGFPVSSLKPSEKRPNLSITVTREGTVEIGERVPVALRDRVPPVVRTRITRSYTVIKDGLLNVDKLPVRLTESTWAKLSKEQLVSGPYSSDVVVLDLARLPIVNAKMCGELSAKTIFETQFALIKARCAAKVFGHFADAVAPQPSPGLFSAYGQEAVDFLKSVGVTDSGFNPKGTASASTDVYRAKEVVVALKGLTSAPNTKVQEVIDKLAALDAKAPKAKALTPGQALFVSAIREVQTATAKDPGDLPAWVNGRLAEEQRRVRDLIAELARARFAIAVGQVWPKEFSSLDENTMTLPFDGTDVLCTLEMTEPEVAI